MRSFLVQAQAVDQHELGVPVRKRRDRKTVTPTTMWDREATLIEHGLVGKKRERKFHRRVFCSTPHRRGFVRCEKRKGNVRWNVPFTMVGPLGLEPRTG